MTIQNEPRLGPYLKQTRRHLGYTLQDVSAATNLRAGQIRAIENSCYDDLPGEVYAVGFVKTYADFLDLDADACGNQFKLELAYLNEGHETDKVPSKKSSKKAFIEDDPYVDNRVPPGFVLGLSFCVLILCLILWQIYKPQDQKSQALLNTILPVPKIEVASSKIEIPIAESLEDNVQDVSNPAEPLENPQPAIKKPEPLKQPEPIITEVQQKDPGQRTSQSRVLIRAHRSSWVQVTDAKRRAVFKKVLRAGDEYFVPNQKGMRLSTSNAGALDIYVDGKKVLPIGVQGDILRGVSLEPEKLLRERARTRRKRR